MWGLTNITSMRVDMNFEARILEIEAQFLDVKGEFEYEMHGRLLIMELNGKGPGFVNFGQLHTKLANFLTFFSVKPNATLTFKLGEYEKRRKKHYKVTGSKLVVAPQSVSANFDNIINGDKELSDNINKMFNDNWKGLFEEIGPTYEDACAQVFQGIFNRVLSKVPVDELFGGE
nr:PREDICTED: protein takeout-like isoform X3 [Tribolium castaneum]|eukprot:XP_015840886.1 PREDICTED: protein takeout-like isoform X3 [Tribolium castaneum]